MSAGRLVRRSRFHVIAGWIASILGIALWTYAYFVKGTPSLITWANVFPPWRLNGFRIRRPRSASYWSSRAAFRSTGICGARVSTPP